MKILLTKPNISTEEINLVTKTIESDWIAQGPMVEKFENIFANYVGSKYAVATNSGTSALHLSIMALNIKKGDKVIIPSFSFIATTNAVEHSGARPVFVDINKETYNIDETKIEKAITLKTKAIMPVDQLGLPYNIDGVNKIAKKHTKK